MRHDEPWLPDGERPTEIEDAPEIEDQKNSDNGHEADVDEDIVKSLPEEKFTVRDEDTANWLVRKIVESRLHAQRVAAWSEREQRRCQLIEERLLFLFGNDLRLWTTTELGRLKGKRKSIDLPDGRVGYRHEAERFVVENEALVVQWAQSSCPDVLKMVPHLSRTALKAHIETTGELPKGVRIEPSNERFFIR